VSLTPRLDSVEALLDKALREQYRALHEADAGHKADHLYNFCITAHSLRDFLLERLGKVMPVDQQPFNDRWSKEPVLRAIGDNANSAKHLQLRDRTTRLPKMPKTKAVRAGRTTHVNVFVSDAGEVKLVKDRRVRTYYVTIDGGRELELSAFIDEAIKYWRSELKSHGMKLRRQSFRQLAGVAA
jgi:hypothetical protein